MKTSHVIQADLDEILFEHREKEYGAYHLRRHYEQRLLLSALSVFVVFLMGAGFPKLMVEKGTEHLDHNKGVLTMVDVPEVMPPPEKPREEMVVPPSPPPPPRPNVDRARFVVPVPSSEVLEDVTINAIDSLKGKVIDWVDEDGDSTAEYDFDLIDRDTSATCVNCELGEAPIVDKIPSINEWIQLEKEPIAVNMKEIKKSIKYPKQLVEIGLQGTVTVRILVGKSGEVLDYRVLQKTHPLMVKAVEGYITQLQFTPGIQAGRPVTVWVNQQFAFKQF